MSWYELVCWYEYLLKRAWRVQAEHKYEPVGLPLQEEYLRQTIGY